MEKSHRKKGKGYKTGAVACHKQDGPVCVGTVVCVTVLAQNLFFHIMLSIGLLGCPEYLALDFWLYLVPISPNTGK